MGRLREPGAVLLISCYELGHQPMAAALPFGFLQRAGFSPSVMDIAVEPFDAARVESARLVAIAVPMHTALRLGVRVADRVREINPAAKICFYGLYAVLNAPYLLDHGADYCIGGECEGPLVALAEALDAGEAGDVEGVLRRGGSGGAFLQRLPFAAPDRSALPPLESYAGLEIDGERRVAGYTEATRGCKHLCTHCPIPPVYGGRFFALPREVVLADIRAQVGAGAAHITFGDPDFLNGPSHSLRIVREMHAEFPHITFDFTAKVQHILERPELFPEFATLGCVFVVSAVESLSERVLAILEKHHTRQHVRDAIRVVHDAGIAMRPTWVPFTPWTTRDDYVEMVDFVEENGLIGHVDTVQYAIRLLVPPGSLLAEHPQMLPHRSALDPAAFTYRWSHPDAGMDLLQKEISVLVEADTQAERDPADTFYRVQALARGRTPGDAPIRGIRPGRAPRLTESWFC